MTPGPRRRLEVLADGTVRQQSPVSGTVVWTVPGRSHRPLPTLRPPAVPLDPATVDSACPFCPDRYLETTPEKARLPVGPSAPEGEPGPVMRHLPADRVVAEHADVRRIPNLFEILPLSYWQASHQLTVPDALVARARAYAATPLGRHHIQDLLRVRRSAAGATVAHRPPDGDADLAAASLGLFASTHDLIIPRRHYLPDATTDDQLCGAGDLGSDGHHRFFALTIDALRDLAGAHEFVRYVSVFQNWLAPAGASIEHLHKQLVAIDDHGPLMSRVIDTLGSRPDLFNTAVVDPALGDGLVIAGNEHALAIAGVGHRYPTVELYSTAATNLPWEHDAAALRSMSDLLHACHAATGRLVPTNEEWHFRPRDVTVSMPWRINLKWRVSTLAGFEGGTKINVNTISPFDLRERVVARLTALRAEGRIAPLLIGDECRPGPSPLAYREG